MPKPTQQQIKEAKETLAAAGFAVEALWSIDDVNYIISELDNPEDFQTVTDAGKLDFLNGVLDSTMSSIWHALGDDIECLND